MITYIIHSGDKGAWIWPFWIKYFMQHWDFTQHVMRPLFLGETMTPDFTGTDCWLTGPVPYGEGLMRALEQIQDDYVVLTHEDYFLTGKIKYDLLAEIVALMSTHGLHLVKTCGWWSGWTTDDAPMVESAITIPSTGERLWLYNPQSPYLTSHQPSIWRRDFLLSTLQPHWGPWQHELEGSDLLRQRGGFNIYSYRGEQPIPYAETVTAGKARAGAEHYFL